MGERKRPWVQKSDAGDSDVVLTSATLSISSIKQRALRIARTFKTRETVSKDHAVIFATFDQNAFQDVLFDGLSESKKREIKGTTSTEIDDWKNFRAQQLCFVARSASQQTIDLLRYYLVNMIMMMWDGEFVWPARDNHPPIQDVNQTMSKLNLAKTFDIGEFTLRLMRCLTALHHPRNYVSDKSGGQLQIQLIPTAACDCVLLALLEEILENKPAVELRLIQTLIPLSKNSEWVTKNIITPNYINTSEWETWRKRILATDDSDENMESEIPASAAGKGQEKGKGKGKGKGKRDFDTLGGDAETSGQQFERLNALILDDTKLTFPQLEQEMSNAHISQRFRELLTQCFFDISTLREQALEAERLQAAKKNNQEKERKLKEKVLIEFRETLLAETVSKDRLGSVLQQYTTQYPQFAANFKAETRLYLENLNASAAPSPSSFDEKKLETLVTGLAEDTNVSTLKQLRDKINKWREQLKVPIQMLQRNKILQQLLQLRLVSHLNGLSKKDVLNRVESVSQLREILAKLGMTEDNWNDKSIQLLIPQATRDQVAKRTYPKILDDFTVSNPKPMDVDSGDDGKPVKNPRESKSDEKYGKPAGQFEFESPSAAPASTMQELNMRLLSIDTSAQPTISYRDQTDKMFIQIRQSRFFFHTRTETGGRVVGGITLLTLNANKVVQRILAARLLNEAKTPGITQVEYEQRIQTFQEVGLAELPKEIEQLLAKMPPGDRSKQEEWRIRAAQGPIWAKPDVKEPPLHPLSLSYGQQPHRPALLNTGDKTGLNLLQPESYSRIADELVSQTLDDLKRLNLFSDSSITFTVNDETQNDWFIVVPKAKVLAMDIKTSSYPYIVKKLAAHTSSTDVCVVLSQTSEARSILEVNIDFFTGFPIIQANSGLLEQLASVFSAIVFAQESGLMFDSESFETLNTTTQPREFYDKLAKELSLKNHTDLTVSFAPSIYFTSFGKNSAAINSAKHVANTPYWRLKQTSSIPILICETQNVAVADDVEIADNFAGLIIMSSDKGVLGTIFQPDQFEQLRFSADFQTDDKSVPIVSHSVESIRTGMQALSLKHLL